MQSKSLTLFSKLLLLTLLATLVPLQLSKVTESKSMPIPSPLILARLIDADYQGALAGEEARIEIQGVSSCIFPFEDQRILIIRGTDEFSDWIRYNFNGEPECMQGDTLFWHKGFLHHAQVAYAFAKDKGVTLVTGHSLGAAAAGIVGYSLKVPAITFATPRAIYKFSVNQYTEPCCFGITNYCRADDLVTKVPPSFLNYFHLGDVVWLNPAQLHIGEEHRIKHYIEILSLIEND